MVKIRSKFGVWIHVVHSWLPTLALSSLRRLGLQGKLYRTISRMVVVYVLTFVFTCQCCAHLNVPPYWAWSVYQLKEVPSLASGDRKVISLNCILKTNQPCSLLLYSLRWWTWFSSGLWGRHPASAAGWCAPGTRCRTACLGWPAAARRGSSAPRLRTRYKQRYHWQMGGHAEISKFRFAFRKFLKIMLNSETFLIDYGRPQEVPIWIFELKVI